MQITVTTAGTFLNDIRVPEQSDQGSFIWRPWRSTDKLVLSANIVPLLGLSPTEDYRQPRDIFRNVELRRQEDAGLRRFCQNPLATVTKAGHFAAVILFGSRYMKLTAECILNSRGSVIGLQGRFIDWSSEYNARAQIEATFRTDPATGLPLGSVFDEQLGHALAGRHSWLAVMRVDVDGMSRHNATLGHDETDAAIASLGSRLRSMRSANIFPARRYTTGDEFDVLVTASSQDELDQHLDAVMKTVVFLHPTKLSGGGQVLITATAGVAIARSGVSVDQLRKRADLACLDAKSEKVRILTYNDQLLGPSAKKASRRAAEASLAADVVKGGFSYAYQPIVDIHSGWIVSIEALSRRLGDHVDLGMPSEYIPVLEDTGKIIGFERDGFKEVVSQISLWQKRWPEQSLDVHCNFSASQFRNPGFDELILRFMKRRRFRPECLTMEITESERLALDSPIVRQALANLQSHGVKFAIDDYPQEFSSARLLDEPFFSYVKVDRSLVLRLGSEDEQVYLEAQDLIRAASRRGRTVIAEGVESVDILNRLREAGVQYAQGYLFHQALSPERLEALLANPDMRENEVVFASSRYNAV